LERYQECYSMENNVNTETKQSEGKKQSISSYLKVAGKGMCVGGSMLVPGVSGGSMAMILGIYDRLIDAVSSFFKHVAASLRFLLIFSVSAGVGMILFAKPLLNLIEIQPTVMMYFFIGAVVGSVPMIIRKAEVKQFQTGVIIYPMIGMLMMYAITLLPKNLLTIGDRSNLVSYLPMFLAGIVVAIALVLPGISVSYMLLVLGLYEETMKAISNVDVLFLLPLGLGLIAGIILTTKLLETAMTKQPGPTYLIILGFIIASCIDVFPGVPVGFDFVLAIAVFVCGMVLIAKISKE